MESRGSGYAGIFSANVTYATGRIAFAMDIMAMNIAAKTSCSSKMASAAYFRSALKLPRPTSEFVAAENAYRKESGARRGLSGRLEALKIEANIDNPSTAKIPTPGTDSFKDQTGGGRHFEKIGVTSAQPAFTTAGPISRTCADFNGITSQLIGASISNFVGLSSGFVICSGYIDAINANNIGAGNAANNDILWVTTLVTNGTSIPGPIGQGSNFVSYPWQVPSTAISTGVPVVTTWRHEGGSLYSQSMAASRRPWRRVIPSTI